MYRRIGLRDLAAKLGRSRYEAEQAFISAVDRGILKGFIGRATDEFVIQEAVGQEKVIEACPRRGANL